MKKHEFFSSRWGLLLAALGMCVGTGNIWRFPRMAAQHGGGTFVLAWMIFLFTWSIPLLIVEFTLGKDTRLGAIGAVARTAGRRYAWMGGFVVVCSSAIMFYYSVVTGWCFKYFILAATGRLSGLDHAGAARCFGAFTSSLQPVLFHLAAMVLVCFIVYQGVVAGIERASKVIVPALFVLLAVAAVRAALLPNAVEGLKFLFKPDLRALGDHKVWLQALTQSAWSTGAGWGLLLTYAIYAKPDHGPVRDSFLAGLGNNAASLLAAVAIFSTIFAVSPGNLSRIAAAGNTGFAFEWMPELFNRVPAGRLFASAFFLALSFAAISSLISMVEMASRAVMDFGLGRRPAICIVGGLAFLLGFPSAISMGFFENQDWAWGIGLMLSGLFVAFAAIKYGVRRFHKEKVNVIAGDWRVGRWFEIVIMWVVPVEFAAMVGWWFSKSIAGGEAWWNPFGKYTVGTCLFQWGIAAAVLLLLNKRAAARLDRLSRIAAEPGGDTRPRPKEGEAPCD